MNIKDLPQPYQDLIKKRTNAIADLEPPLIHAFHWSSTPEGHAFWYAVYRAKTVDELPAIPTQAEVA